MRAFLMVLLCGALALTGCDHPPAKKRGDMIGRKTTPPPLDHARHTALQAELRRDVTMLATTIGPRHTRALPKLNAARDYIQQQLEAAGWTVTRQPYTSDGVEVSNLSVELRGTTRPDEIVVIGAHYDTVASTPGADDNASGVAGTLALARWVKAQRLTTDRTLRFVFFVNEEPPHFYTEEMGSLVYARACARRGDRVVGMVSLEMLGFYTDTKGSQKYPPVVGVAYPDRGNFIGFVANFSSRKLNGVARKAFRASVAFPTESITAPEAVPGVGFSDHWSFWRADYPAIMITDTAFFRNPHYHEPTDTPDRLDYDRFAKVMIGVQGMTQTLASAATKL